MPQHRVLIVGAGSSGAAMAAALIKNSAAEVVLLPDDARSGRHTEVQLEQVVRAGDSVLLVVDQSLTGEQINALRSRTPEISPEFEECALCAAPWGWAEDFNEDLRYARRTCRHDALHRERIRRTPQQRRAWRRYEAVSIKHERIR